MLQFPRSSLGPVRVNTGDAGTETWRRAVADVDRIEFTVMSSDTPQRTIIWTKGQRPPRVEGSSDKFSSIQVKVMGTNLCGHQLIDAAAGGDRGHARADQVATSNRTNLARELHRLHYRLVLLAGRPEASDERGRLDSRRGSTLLSIAEHAN